MHQIELIKNEQLKRNRNDFVKNILWDKLVWPIIIPVLFIEKIEQTRELNRSFNDQKDINILSHDKWENIFTNISFRRNQCLN